MTQITKPSLPWLAIAAVATWAATTADAPPPNPVQLVPGLTGHAIVDGHHVQPRGDVFRLPDRADVSPTDARILDQLYIKQMQPGRSMPTD